MFAPQHSSHGRRIADVNADEERMARQILALRAELAVRDTRTLTNSGPAFVLCLGFLLRKSLPRCLLADFIESLAAFGRGTRK